MIYRIRRCRRSFFFTALFLLCLVSNISCYGSWNFAYEGNNVDSRTKSIKKINDSNDEEFAESGISSLGGKYTVLVISDAHFGNKKRSVNCDILYKWLDSLKGNVFYPSFVISLGDSTDLGRRNQFDEYNDFCKILCEKYDLKLVMNACGNHDAYQNNWENWERECYPHTSFYNFKTKKFSWYCLDTASGTLGLKQCQKILDEFKDDPRPKIIFTHYPFARFNTDCSNMAETTERNLLISDFSKNNVKCLLGGHNHTQTYDNLGYGDYGIPSFAYSEAWGLLCVDEAAETAELLFIGDGPVNEIPLLDDISFVAE